MRRRDFIAVVGASADAWPLRAFAQQATRVPRAALVGVSGAVTVADMKIGGDPNWAAFLEEMESLGFVEGPTVTFDRYLTAATNAQDDARMIVASAPDVIFWDGATPTALAALEINQTIPMVVWTGDLLGQGVVSNLAHPGGNVTGISTTAGPDFEGKHLALLAEAVPFAKTFAYTNLGANGQFDASKTIYLQSVSNVASKLGLSMVPIVYAAGGGEAEFTKAFATISASKAEMVVFGADTALTAAPQEAFLAKLALAARLPAIAPHTEFAELGGFLSYGANTPDLARRNADYVALILNGANPGDLPALQPTVFDLVVNLKTARAIGITIPQSLLLQATEVIQ